MTDLRAFHELNGRWDDRTALPNLEHVDAGVRVLLELLERALDGPQHEIVVQLTTEVQRVADNEARDAANAEQRLDRLRHAKEEVEGQLRAAREDGDRLRLQANLYADTLIHVEDKLAQNDAQWHAGLRDLIAETLA